MEYSLLAPTAMDKARARGRREEGVEEEVEREGRRKAWVVEGVLAARTSRRREEEVAAMAARSIFW